MTKKFKTISRLPEFNRDMKKLSKRFRSLEDDLNTFVNTALYARHKLGTDTKGIVSIPGLGVGREIYKARSFACKSLKGRGKQSGIRVIYTYYDETDEVELIEMYYKGDKENEDRGRMRERHK